MVLDTSAILSILLDEQKAPSLARAVVEDKNRLICVFNVLEAETIIDAKKGPDGRKLLESLLRRIHAQILPLNHSQRNLGSGGHAPLRKQTKRPRPGHRAVLRLRAVQIHRRAAALRKRRFSTHRRSRRPARIDLIGKEATTKPKADATAMKTIALGKSGIKIPPSSWALGMREKMWAGIQDSESIEAKAACSSRKCRNGSSKPWSDCVRARKSKTSPWDSSRCHGSCRTRTHAP